MKVHVVLHPCQHLLLAGFFACVCILAISNKSAVVFIAVWSYMCLMTLSWAMLLAFESVFFGSVSVQILCPFLSWNVCLFLSFKCSYWSAYWSFLCRSVFQILCPIYQKSFRVLLNCGILGPIPDLMNWDLLRNGSYYCMFHKFHRWFSCTLKFVNHSCIIWWAISEL